jgi:hypothetical protein
MAVMAEAQAWAVVALATAGAGAAAVVAVALAVVLPAAVVAEEEEVPEGLRSVASALVPVKVIRQPGSA